MKKTPTLARLAKRVAAVDSCRFKTEQLTGPKERLAPAGEEVGVLSATLVTTRDVMPSVPPFRAVME